jgi:hypothetical protein
MCADAVWKDLQEISYSGRICCMLSECHKDASRTRLTWNLSTLGLGSALGAGWRTRSLQDQPLLNLISGRWMPATLLMFVEMVTPEGAGGQELAQQQQAVSVSSRVQTPDEAEEPQEEEDDLMPDVEEEPEEELDDDEIVATSDSDGNDYSDPERPPTLLMFEEMVNTRGSWPPRSKYQST